VKTPAPSSTRSAKNAASASERFASGPARAINAARRGYAWVQVGFTGTLAQPIIQPLKRKLMIGTSTMPTGERRMCGSGSSEAWPPA
jgi:hypothetical protein